jgi:hypothetical protein
MKNICLVAATIIITFSCLFAQSFAQLQTPPKDKYEVDRSPRTLPPLGVHQPALVVTGFKINNGAENTSSLTVALNNKAQGEPNYWMASESPDFTKNVITGPYSETPQYALSASGGAGQRTVYFRVFKVQADKSLRYSQTMSDTINYTPPVVRVTYVIKAGSAYEHAKNRGFTFTAVPAAVASYCHIYGVNEGALHVDAVTSRMTGSKCDFILFGGKQLKEGWTFKSYREHADCAPPKRNYSVNQKPTSGSRDITFKAHLWADPPMTVVGDPAFNACDYFIDEITLEGPSSPSWRAAFE